MENEKKHLSLPLIFLITLFVAILIKLFIFDVVKVSGTSMEPAIKDGEFVFINKLAYGLVIPFSSQFFFQWKEPEKNDIVLFLHDDKMVVKRTIAKENAKLVYYIEDHYTLDVEGKKIQLTEKQYDNLKNYDLVPPGMIFALGDNQSASIDSRDYGFISVKNTIGKVLWK